MRPKDTVSCRQKICGNPGYRLIMVRRQSKLNDLSGDGRFFDENNGKFFAAERWSVVDSSNRIACWSMDSGPPRCVKRAGRGSSDELGGRTFGTRSVRDDRRQVVSTVFLSRAT
ncbi:MAG: hypothetical protein D6725_07570 [Planctomycetota bacterium]|nr:MAG: hypothetical protein D6725_07570 [Planctomycetota bacterium]